MEYKGTLLSECLYLATTRCNCRCKHCTPSVYTGKAVELSSQQMIALYKKSVILRNIPIYITGGEPFMKEDLDEFILYLAEQQIPCVITTNGWYYEKIESLLGKLGSQKSVKFAISIDGPEKMHDDIRRKKGIYQKAVESAKLIRSADFEVQINTVIQKDNLAGLDEFDFFFKKNDIPVVYIPKVFVGTEKFNFTAEDIHKIFRYVNYPRGRKYLLSSGNYLIRNCHAGKSSWTIDCNGDIYACLGGYYKKNSKDYIMGNIRESDFDEILASQKKEMVCRETVNKCEGCLLPCEIERETEIFHYSTKLTYDEVALLKDDLGKESLLQDFAITEEEWYGSEKLGNKSFRWMRNKYADIYVSKEDNEPGKLSINYLNGKPEVIGDQPIIAEIFINGENAGKHECLPGEGTIEIEWNKNWKSLIQVQIQVNRTWRPCDYAKTSDSRVLGLAIFKVEVI